MTDEGSGVPADAQARSAPPGWVLRPIEESSGVHAGGTATVVADPATSTEEAARPRTTVPDHTRPAEPQARRRVGGMTRTDRLNLVGAAASSLSLTILLFGRLAAFSGLIGFVVFAFVLFIVVYAVLVGLTEDGPTVRDKIATVVLYSVSTVVLLSLLWIIFFTLFRGWKALKHLNFFTQDLSQAGPLSPLNRGGLAHALVGTLWMIGIALALTAPLGLACAVYLNEVGGRLSRFVRTITVAMTALPSIVAGLFIYIFFIVTLRFEHSGLAAALALSVMMLPIITRAADLVLRLVPGSLREASLALGAPQWRTVWHVVLPTARSGLATAVILGTARGIGETSPVLLTAGYTTYLNTNPLHGPMVSLPLAAFQLVSSGVPQLVYRGFGAAAFLLLIVLILFFIARLLGGRQPGQVGRRQARRIQRQSARDLARFESRAVAWAPAGGVRTAS
jgi:phosphate transport system permease protein